MTIRATIQSSNSARETMRSAADDLASITGASESEIVSLSRTFQALAKQSSELLSLASTIVECIEDDSVRSVLPTVQALGSAGIRFVESSLEATKGIVDTAATEVTILTGLSKVIRSQSGIALRTRVLAMMTNIEMGRLGNSGAAFEYLVGVLNNFSKTLSEDTDELESRTDARRIAIEATSRLLASELAPLTEELVNIRGELGNDLAQLESSLGELAEIPAQFKADVEKIGEQIAGVVAAIQSYDITRQQIDHVQQAIARIANEIPGRLRRANSQQRTRTSLGIKIQIYQLQHIRETVANWISRIRDCMGVMLKVSGSNLAGIGPILRDREREVSARLANTESLQNKSKAQSEAIFHKVGEPSGLVQLIQEQVEKAAVTRQTLHLLSLNTALEADRLGGEGNAVLEISKGISDLSLEWGSITDQSGRALDEISELVELINSLTATFSQVEEHKLLESQSHVRDALQKLRATSEFAVRQACDIERGIGAMRSMAGGMTQSVDLLDRSYRQIDTILIGLEDLQLQLEANSSDSAGEYDPEEMKEYFSASYTTEVEREVLQAAFDGAAVPSVQQNLEGNEVELF